MYTLQNVIDFLKEIKPTIKIYIFSLILTHGRKNCTKMAMETGFSRKKIYSFLENSADNSEIIETSLVKLAKETRIKEIERVLIIDPTAILKPYAKKIEDLCYDISGCTKRVEKCLIPAYVTISDKNITIPLCIDFWVQEKIIGKERYRSKVEITKQLIVRIIQMGVDFDYISLDGAFATKEMYAFFKEKNLKFIMRIPRSRCIKTPNGISMQLRKHPEIKLIRNQREKLVIGTIDGQSYCFTAEKRKSKNDDWEVVFLISNLFNLPASGQRKAYGSRWPVEKVIRTTKQKFGAMQCQSIKKEKQQAHILAGFLAYAILSFVKNDKKKQSVDEVVNILRKSAYGDILSKSNTYSNNKQYQNSDESAKPTQENILNISNDYIQSIFM